jgi:hypothetical protein
MQKYKYQKENFPMKFTKKMVQILEKGLIYTCGRDRCFRPVTYISCQKILNLDPKPTAIDVITITLMLTEFNDLHMGIKGKIENTTLIFDLINLSVWHFPYALVKDLLMFM